MSEHTYEAQNDTRLDDLHSKLRTLRGVTTDIHDDVERQNRTLDDTGDTFDAFGNQLAQTSRNAARAFGLNGQGIRQCRTIGIIVAAMFALWILWHIASWWIGPSSATPA
ncbi:hypothetical protein EXIGLDRAFT_637004 [Exidia glandulosa HHB12029]|uniref:t-SNARE coiled-coil homology domain-containing protein n=1 Tax=Exidia glandulosa HHB12029 TaxID=1314781 RepID=A0A165Q0P5_EXIGL|nr:hypothetical protein EXIGLDRAFT_637004 [Exidia glandulosa HHB12029]